MVPHSNPFGVGLMAWLFSIFQWQDDGEVIFHLPVAGLMVRLFFYIYAYANKIYSEIMTLQPLQYGYMHNLYDKVHNLSFTISYN